MTIVENPVVVMERYEMKYLLDPAQADHLRDRMKGHMSPDQFGLTSIASLYYDTPDHRLVNRSIEKPDYKEKIRIRSYGPATDTSPVFLELKRKAYGIVYKRRIASTIPQVNAFFDRADDALGGGGQINRELAFFRDYYRDLVPSCIIIYDRTAYFEPEGDLRLTIDDNPRYRTDDLDLRSSMDGISLLPPGYSILEIKVHGAMPLWLTSALSEAGIYKTSFSKYGEAYRQQVCGLTKIAR